MTEGRNDWIIVGRVSGLYGVRGWLRIFSYTEPREGIVEYDPWYLNLDGEWRPMDVTAGRRHGKGVVAHLKEVQDRDAATPLIGADIAIRRDQLPALPPGEFYWADLVGLQVVTVDGVALGTVDYVFETGANDVLVVKNDRERLIPFIRGDVVVEVDLDGGLMRVDWDPEF